MVKLNVAVLSLTLTFVFSSLSLGQTAEVKAIDAYAAKIMAFTKKRTNPKLVFADVSNAETEQPSKYQKFVSEKALEKHRDKSEVYSIAYAWKKGGKVVATNFTLSSPSGDWVKYVFSYFRANGTLAKVDIDYRTFYGDFRMVEKIYFDTSGKELSRKSEFCDLKTNKFKMVDQDYKEANSMLFSAVDHYISTDKLPFADLLK